MKKTIAFIGVEQKHKDLLFRVVSNDHAVLLVPKELTNEILSLQTDLLKFKKYASVELSTCSKDCAWESDVIVLDVDIKSLEELCLNINKVVTGKIIITNDDELYYHQVKTLFPNSKVVWLNENHVFSDDTIAIQKITEILY